MRPFDLTRVSAVIPALDEEASIAAVVAGLRRQGLRDIIVVDNGSIDCTAQRAASAGARVIYEPQKGYGAACLAGIAALADRCEIVVFMDADGSDEPARLVDLLAPIFCQNVALVVGSRALGTAQRGALTLPQQVGNTIAAHWLHRRFRLRATDLGPFRAIRRSALRQLDMRDRSFGWTVEMQIKVALHGLSYREVPVPYYRRRGRSKISGTLRGTLGASTKIIAYLLRYDRLRPRA